MVGRELTKLEDRCVRSISRKYAANSRKNVNLKRDSALGIPIVSRVNFRKKHRISNILEMYFKTNNAPYSK